MFFAALEDELIKRANGDAIEFMRNQGRRKKWLKGNARERFVKSRSGSKKRKKMAKKAEVPLVDPVASAITDMGRTIDEKIEEHQHPINVLLGAALGGGLGVPVGALTGGAIQSHRIGKRMIHPDQQAGLLRKLLHAKREMPEGAELARQVRKAVNRGVLVGGGSGLLLGGLLGHQIAKAMKQSREAKELAEKNAQVGSLARAAATSAIVKPLGLKTPTGVLLERVREGGEPEPPKKKETHKERAERLDRERMQEELKRTLRKKAGVAKKTLTYDGLTMKFEFLRGDTRSGVNGATGKKWSRVMKDHYGYMPGTYGKGADGEAIDVYFNPKPIDGPIYCVKQKKKTGEFDEEKYMIGYGNAAEAKKAFLRNMPEWAFMSMRMVSTPAFRKLVGQPQKKGVVRNGDTDRDKAARLIPRKSAA